jgi:hypothetical protein
MTQQKEDLLEKAADVAEAVEQNLTKEEEASLGKPSGAKNLIHVITSVTALVAALGAFMKTCDHTLTRNAYNTLSESISKIEDEQKKNHEDLLKLQAYLDGMARAPITSTSVTSTTASTVDAGAPVPSPSPSPSPKLLGKNPEFNHAYPVA